MISEVSGIDIHAHAVPQRFLEQILKSPLAGVEVEKADDRYVLTFPGAKPLRPIAGPMMYFAERGEWFDSQKLKSQIVAPWLDIDGQRLASGDGQEWVRQLNNAMAEEVAETNRMYAYATLFLADPKAATAELERAATELHMAGAMIPTHIPEGKLTDPEFAPLWEAAASLNMPIVLHPPTVSPSNCLFDEFPQSGVHGRAIDTTIMATQLVLTGVIDRHPDLNFVLVHGGGFFPYQAGRLGGEGPLVNIQHGGKEEGPKGLSKPVLEYVKSFHYDSVLIPAPGLRFLFEMAGIDKVMIGSDFGARAKFSDHPLVGALGELNLPKEKEQMVLFKNAESLFQL